MKAKTILAALRGFFTGAEDENASWKCFICLVIRLKRNELDFDVCGAADCVLFNQLYFICLCEISLYRGGGGGGGRANGVRWSRNFHFHAAIDLRDQVDTILLVVISQDVTSQRDNYPRRAIAGS